MQLDIYIMGCIIFLAHCFWLKKRLDGITVVQSSIKISQNSFVSSFQIHLFCETTGMSSSGIQQDYLKSARVLTEPPAGNHPFKIPSCSCSAKLDDQIHAEDVPWYVRLPSLVTATSSSIIDRNPSPNNLT